MLGLHVATTWNMEKHGESKRHFSWFDAAIILPAMILSFRFRIITSNCFNIAPFSKKNRKYPKSIKKIHTIDISAQKRMCGQIIDPGTPQNHS